MVEVMAIGVPVVATSDSVNGMDLTPGRHFAAAETTSEMASETLRLLNDRVRAEDLSRRARDRVNDSFSFEQTYGSLARHLAQSVAPAGEAVAV